MRHGNQYQARRHVGRAETRRHGRARPRQHRIGVAGRNEAAGVACAAMSGSIIWRQYYVDFHQA